MTAKNLLIILDVSATGSNIIHVKDDGSYVACQEQAKAALVLGLDHDFVAKFLPADKLPDDSDLSPTTLMETLGSNGESIVGYLETVVEPFMDGYDTLVTNGVEGDQLTEYVNKGLAERFSVSMVDNITLQELIANKAAVSKLMRTALLALSKLPRAQLIEGIPTSPAPSADVENNLTYLANTALIRLLSDMHLTRLDDNSVDLSSEEVGLIVGTFKDEQDESAYTIAIKEHQELDAETQSVEYYDYFEVTKLCAENKPTDDVCVVCF